MVVLWSAAMEVVALGPFYVAALPWQRQSRDWVLTVVCKATFDLVPGELRLSQGQEPINDADNHWDDDPRRSVYSPSDMAPFRKGADITLVGHAFAAHHQPCRSLLARIVIGTVDKAVEVHADRSWSGEAQITDGPAFTHMPLRYERAQGGPGTMNPVGIPIVPGPLPNLHPARRRGTLQDDGSPVGFGPIAAGWPQRESRLRRHRGAFSHTEWSQKPLPDDIEVEYFNAAPADQRIAEITPDLDIMLEHLHPEHPRLAMRLPGMKPQAFLERPQAGAQEISLVGDALWMDTDRAICTVTWRGQIPLVSRDERGRVLIAMGSARQKLTWEDVQRLQRAFLQKQQTAPSPGQTPAQAMAAAPQAPAKPAQAAAKHQIFEEESVETEVLSTEELARQEGTNLPAWLADRLRAQGKASQPAHPAVQPPASAPVTQPATIAASSVAQAPAAPARPPATASRPPLPYAPAPAAVVPPMPPVPAITPAPSIAAAPSIATPTLVSPPSPVPPAEVARPLPVDSSAQTMPREMSPWAASGGTNPTAFAPTHTPVAAPVAPGPMVEEAKPKPQPSRSSRRAGFEVVDLLWFDAASVPRLRAAFPSIVDELEFEPIDPKHDLPMDDPNASRDRHDTFGILTRAVSTDGRGIGRSMLDAVSDTGRFTPPVVMIAGELRFPFDEVELLKATVAAISPLVREEDKKLKDALEAAQEVLKTPLLQAPSNVEAVTSELRDSLRQAKRAVTLSQLDTHIERVLLEQRKYQKRTVFGDEQIRALCFPAGETTPIPAYLPAILATKLPLLLRMKCRLLAEAHAQQDQYEAHANALRVIALGRLVSMDGFR